MLALSGVAQGSTIGLALKRLSVNGSRFWNKLPLEIRRHVMLLNITSKYIWLIIKTFFNSSYGCKNDIAVGYMS